MKNVTLSIPDELLAKSREYALAHNTSLNQMIREYLSLAVTKKKDLESLFNHMDKVKVRTNILWTRDDLYKR